MNADFEAELASEAANYRRRPSFDVLSRRLAPQLLWLARKGDALLLSEPWSETLKCDALRRGVELVSPERLTNQTGRIFTPWGWTPSAVAAGEQAGAVVSALPHDVVTRVNSKLWSHELEVDLGVALSGSAIADTFEELQRALVAACPSGVDRWVIKSPFGFAARDRVLGRGPSLEEPAAVWCRRRFARGETLIFQPWLEVIREYGIVMEISPEGAFEIRGISDLQTNGAGTGKGYILGRAPAPKSLRELERIADLVSQRLSTEGYFGPVGIDALEHSRGVHPLLEINARWTMGFVALAVERSLKPTEPTFWATDYAL